METDHKRTANYTEQKADGSTADISETEQVTPNLVLFDPYWMPEVVF